MRVPLPTPLGPQITTGRGGAAEDESGGDGIIISSNREWSGWFGLDNNIFMSRYHTLEREDVLLKRE